MKKESEHRVGFHPYRWIMPILLGASMLGCTMDAPQQQQQGDRMEFTIHTDESHQTIHNFGASDAWSIQFVGKNWPLSKREEIAELLFSQELEEDGSPRGIALSAWRFNIGAGSAEQGMDSQIDDEWRRAEGFLNADGSYDWSKQAGQQWFLKKAKELGVKDFIAFVNSPPVALTTNGKAWSQDGLQSNLSESNYQAYADYLVQVLDGLEQQTGVRMDYISPVNEPQWEWKCCGQEGSPWNNDEIAKVTRVINETFEKEKVTQTKIEISESGQIDYLFDPSKSPDSRTQQVSHFFSPNSEHYLGDLKYLAHKVAGHSYYSTWDPARLQDTRSQLKNEIQKIDPSLEYWMSEYCILEDNETIKGAGRDLGMDAALYMARVIHSDLTLADASAWHWWLAVSSYDYKDGLIYIDHDQKDGEVYESKMLWTLGQFSRFIRPGSKRLALTRPEQTEASVLDEVLVSAYAIPEGEIVIVLINQSEEDQKLTFSGMESDLLARQYQTSDHPDDNMRLVDLTVSPNNVIVPGHSVVTLVFQP